MAGAIDRLFSELDIHPVLVEVGATGRLYDVWEPIAHHAIYVGIGAEPHILSEPHKEFYKSIIVPKVVKTVHAGQPVVLHRAGDPILSSLLKPNTQAMSEFLDLDLRLARDTVVEASSFDSIMDKLSITKVDWLSSNVNGIDTGIYKSIGGRLRKPILAVNATLYYLDMFADQEPVSCHYDYIEDGFWLSNARNCGEIRMRKDSLRRLCELDRGIRDTIQKYYRRTPCWVFARYFKTLESLAALHSAPRDYIVLWAFALLDDQFGFATDVAFEYERLFGADKFSHVMLYETVRRTCQLKPTLSIASVGRRVLPQAVRRYLRRLLYG